MLKFCFVFLKLASRRKAHETSEEDEKQYKVDMGEKVDHWFQLYGKAVEDNTLQDRIEAHRLHQLQQQQQSWFRTQQEEKNKFSYVQQLLMEEEEEKLKSDTADNKPQMLQETKPQNSFICNQPNNSCIPIPLAALKNIVRNVLFHQGISNPSDQVLDESIQNYLQSEQVNSKQQQCDKMAKLQISYLVLTKLQYLFGSLSLL